MAIVFAAILGILSTLVAAQTTSRNLRPIHESGSAPDGWMPEKRFAT
jgi:hypothetical protein